jgi:hypothetical protein
MLPLSKKEMYPCVTNKKVVFSSIVTHFLQIMTLTGMSFGSLAKLYEIFKAKAKRKERNGRGFKE